MEYFEKIVISLTLLLAGSFVVLYFCRPWLNKHLKITEKSIVIIEQKYIPKTGVASLLSISGNKYLIVSNANAIAISVIDETGQSSNLQVEK